MDYQKQCQEFDTKIRSIQKIEPLDCYISDGVVNIEKWRHQQIRPLFIGKEAYDKEGRLLWNYTDWLNNQPQDAFSASPRTWPTTAYLSFALQNEFKNYNDIPFIQDDERVANALQNIAFINIGKYGAETKTPARRLEELFVQNKHVLNNQIEFYQPNIVIGWSTLDFFVKDEEFLRRFSKSDIIEHTKEGITYWAANGRLFISAYHPASFEVSQEQYVNGIVDAVRECMSNKEIDLSLPSL